MSDPEFAEIESRYYHLDAEQQYLRLVIEKTEHELALMADPALIEEYAGHLRAFRKRYTEQQDEMKRLEPILIADRDRQIAAGRLHREQGE